MMAKKITEDGEIVDELCEECGPIFFKTPYNHDRDAESDRTGLECKDVSRTKQEFANDADINNILAKFLNGTAGLPQLTQPPQYMNLEEEFDLQSKMVTSAQVEEAWNTLPAAVRNILKNPSTFVSYIDHCLETGDLDPLRELGLAEKIDYEPPDKAIQPPSPPGGSPAPPTETKGPETAPKS